MTERKDVPHGQKTIKVKVVFWTNDLAGEPGAIKPGHAWYSGMAHVEANPAPGIRSQPDPIPFNTPAELQTAIDRCLKSAGVVMHDPRTAAIIEA